MDHKFIILCVSWAILQPDLLAGLFPKAIINDRSSRFACARKKKTPAEFHDVVVINYPFFIWMMIALLKGKWAHKLTNYRLYTKSLETISTQL